MVVVVVVVVDCTFDQAQHLVGFAVGLSLRPSVTVCPVCTADRRQFFHIA